MTSSNSCITTHAGLPKSGQALACDLKVSLLTHLHIAGVELVEGVSKVAKLEAKDATIKLDSQSRSSMSAAARWSLTAKQTTRNIAMGEPNHQGGTSFKAFGHMGGVQVGQQSRHQLLTISYHSYGSTTHQQLASLDLAEWIDHLRSALETSSVASSPTLGNL